MGREFVFNKKDNSFVPVFPEINKNIISTSRNMGELVYSLLPLNDVSLHLTDGSLLRRSNSVHTAFVDWISRLIKEGNHPNLFTTEEEYESSVSKYGVCGKFVYNPDGKTVRIPKVTGLIEGTIDSNALGELTEAGLPNITASSLGLVVTDSDIGESGNGATFEKSLEDISIATADSDGARIYSTGVDASLSSNLYKDDIDTVQPQTIKGYLYITIAVNFGNVVVSDSIDSDSSYSIASSAAIKKLRDSIGDAEFLSQIHGKIVSRIPVDEDERYELFYDMPDGSIILAENEISGSNLPRNLGEVVHSILPMQDASLHLADGSLITEDGPYSSTVTELISRYEMNPTFPCWTSESEWQTTVAIYGACGKWVADPENKTIRIPKLNGIVTGTLNEESLGNLVETELSSLESPGESEQTPVINGYVYVCLLPGVSTASADIKHEITEMVDAFSERTPLWAARAAMPSSKSVEIQFDPSLSNEYQYWKNELGDGYVTARIEASSDSSAEMFVYCSNGVSGHALTRSSVTSASTITVPCAFGCDVSILIGSDCIVNELKFVYCNGTV